MSNDLLHDDTLVEVPTLEPTMEAGGGLVDEALSAPADTKKGKKSKKADAVEGEEKEAKPAAPRYSAGVSHPIVGGRMPLALVYLIRKEGVWDIDDMVDAGKTEEEISAYKSGLASRLAKKYATTVGKISDIINGAGFPYITRDFGINPALEEKAREYLYDSNATQNKEVVGQGHYDSEVADAVMAEVRNIQVWTDAQVAALADVRKASRKNASTESKEAVNTTEA